MPQVNDRLLEQFFTATELGPIVDAMNLLMRRADRTDVEPLLTALNDPWDRRRFGAVYALGWNRKDARIIHPLIGVLSNKNETPYVRAQAAECLGRCGGGKSIRPLIANSTDASEDVRLWCVFALGRIRQDNPHKRHPKLPWRALRRALMARVNDHANPQHARLGWSVHLEALAMLAGEDPADPPTRLFRETINRALQDPIHNPDLWRWATASMTRRDNHMHGEAVSILEANRVRPGTAASIEVAP